MHERINRCKEWKNYPFNNRSSNCMLLGPIFHMKYNRNNNITIKKGTSTK